VHLDLNAESIRKIDESNHTLHLCNPRFSQRFAGSCFQFFKQQHQLVFCGDEYSRRSIYLYATIGKLTVIA
jgi:hypothetical protein